MQVQNRRVLAGSLIAAAAVTLAIATSSAQQPPKPSQPPNVQAAVDAAYAKYPDAQGRQERRLHPGAGQGRSSPLWDRGRHG